MLTPAIDARALDASAVPMGGLEHHTAEQPLASGLRPMPGTGRVVWGNPVERLLRDKARMGPVLRQGKRVIVLDPAFNCRMLADLGALFEAPAPSRESAPLSEPVMDQVLKAELCRWRTGSIRVQPALAMAMARALVPAATGLVPGSGAAERLAGALATLDDGGSLLRRAMPRGLPSSAMGARRALAQGLAQAGHRDPAVLETMQATHALGLRLSCALARHLARYPDWQDSLRAEVRSAPLVKDGLANRLELLDMAICEAWRLLPGAVLVERRLAAPLTVGEHHLPTGTCVAISPAATHADPDLWADPQRFDPLRFSRGRAAIRPAGAWIAPDLLEPGLARAATGLVRLTMTHLLDRFALVSGDRGKLALRTAG